MHAVVYIALPNTKDVIFTSHCIPSVSTPILISESEIGQIATSNNFTFGLGVFIQLLCQKTSEMKR